MFVFDPRLHGPILEKVYSRYEDHGSADFNYEMRPLSYETQKAGVVHWIDYRFNAVASILEQNH